MKKTFLWTLLVCVFLLCSCDFNAPLRNKMLNYYSVDENYVELQGTVISIQDSKIEIDISSSDFDMRLNAETGYGEFTLPDNFRGETILSIGDKITFVSAPMYFYNGHQLPIVSITKNGETILTFEQGKTAYLTWITETFD